MNWNYRTPPKGRYGLYYVSHLDADGFRKTFRAMWDRIEWLGWPTWLPGKHYGIYAWAELPEPAPLPGEGR